MARFGLAAFVLGRALLALTCLRPVTALRPVRLALSLCRSERDTPRAPREVKSTVVGLIPHPQAAAPYLRRMAGKCEQDLAPHAQALVPEETQRARERGLAPLLAHASVGRWTPVVIVLAIGVLGPWMSGPTQPQPSLGTTGTLLSGGIAAPPATGVAAPLIHAFLRHRARAQVARGPGAMPHHPGPGQEADALAAPGPGSMPSLAPLSPAEIEARLAGPLKA